MAEFKDRKERLWTVDITVGSMKRVKDLTGVNLGTLLSNNMQPLADLLQDPIQIVDVLYTLCKPQADTRGVTDVEFGESMAGQTFEAATEAFMEALIDFFPKRQSDLLRTMIAKGQEIQDALAEKVLANLTTTHSEIVLGSQESSE